MDSKPIEWKTSRNVSRWGSKLSTNKSFYSRTPRLLPKKAKLKKTSDYFQEESLAELIKKNWSCLEPNIEKKYEIIRSYNNKDLKDIVDWSKESNYHQTAKKVKLNNI